MSAVIKIENLGKKYKLGSINSGTLREDISEFFREKLSKKKNPADSKKLQNEEFWALRNLNLEIEKGEKIGIIGANGAGKSTLLKILSRITAPTEGRIEINGRISSMLEVGTGFHGELTGRENIYLNGAILGMSRREVDSKIEDIINFSECRQFIDTPVKRYSSGMYVKLAFSVAAHLDSEILIMDEVLAVGDIAFQNKCLEKMSLLSSEQQRTILYVSHNMSTIRKLCTKCAVLSHGKLVYFGDVEKAIEIYSNTANVMRLKNDLRGIERKDSFTNYKVLIQEVEILGRESNVIEFGENLELGLKLLCKTQVEKMKIRCIIRNAERVALATAMSPFLPELSTNEESSVNIELNTSHLSPGKYFVKLELTRPDGYGSEEKYDMVNEAFNFEVIDSKAGLENLNWYSHFWGSIVLPEIKIL